MVAPFHVRIFGVFRAEQDSRPVPGLQGRKVQELLGYLLLHHDTPRPRELLASRLWGDRPVEQARGYLRKTLSQLREVLLPFADAPILETDRESVTLHLTPALQVDALILEQTLSARGPTAGGRLPPRSSRGLLRRSAAARTSCWPAGIRIGASRYVSRTARCTGKRWKCSWTSTCAAGNTGRRASTPSACCATIRRASASTGS